MGELVYLRQQNLDDYHTKPGCKGFFHLGRKDGIQYPVAHIPLVLDNVPFVMCEACQTAYFPRGFETWLEVRLVVSFFDMGCPLPGSIYRMARQLVEKKSDDIADEIGMSRIRYKQFEHKKQNIDYQEEVRLKLCLSRLLDFDIYEFKGISRCDEIPDFREIRNIDVSEFPVNSWF